MGQRLPQLGRLCRGRACAHPSQKQKSSDLGRFAKGDEAEEKEQQFTEYHLYSGHSLYSQKSGCWFATLHFPMKLKEDKCLPQREATAMQIRKPRVLPHCSPALENAMIYISRAL